MERKRCLILCITAVFLISVSVSMSTMKQPLNNENPNNEPVIMKMPTMSYTPHAPIVITSNADFVSQGWPGGGIEGNPYVIEGLSISDTTSYFEIRNCLVTSDELLTNDGIIFDYVENGKILNTVINGTWYGVRIENSVDVVLMNNAAFDNVDTFVIFSSDYIEVTNNTASNNYGSGFILSLSSSCTLKVLQTAESSSTSRHSPTNQFSCTNQIDFRQVPGLLTPIRPLSLRTTAWLTRPWSRPAVSV